MKKIIVYFILIFWFFWTVNAIEINNETNIKNNQNEKNELKYQKLENKVLLLEKELENYNKLHWDYMQIIYWVIWLILWWLFSLMALNLFKSYKLWKQEIENIENEIKNSSKKYLNKIQKDLDTDNKKYFNQLSEKIDVKIWETKVDLLEKISKMSWVINTIIDSDKKNIEKFNNDIDKVKRDNKKYTNKKIFDIDRRFMLSEIKKFRKEKNWYIYELGLITNYLKNSLEYDNYYIQECLKLLEEYVDNYKIIHNHRLVEIYELLEKIEDIKYKEQVIRIKEKIKKLEVK